MVSRIRIDRIELRVCHEGHRREARDRCLVARLRGSHDPVVQPVESLPRTHVADIRRSFSRRVRRYSDFRLRCRTDRLPDQHDQQNSHQPGHREGRNDPGSSVAGDCAGAGADRQTTARAEPGSRRDRCAAPGAGSSITLGAAVGAEPAGSRVPAGGTRTGRNAHDATQILLYGKAGRTRLNLADVRKTISTEIVGFFPLIVKIFLSV